VSGPSYFSDVRVLLSANWAEIPSIIPYRDLADQNTESLHCA
jgi:hypothetical protein